MYIVFARLFLRLTVLFFGVFSVFFFYVFGYKYEKNVWFVRASWVYDVQYFAKKDKQEEFFVNSNKYNFVDNKLIVYGIYKWSCSNIKIWDFQNYQCHWNKKFKKIVYIPKSSILIKEAFKRVFFNLELFDDSNPFIKHYFYWRWIKFTYYEDWDLVYKDDISSKKLVNIKDAEFIGYDKDGLYFISKWKIYLLNIFKN